MSASPTATTHGIGNDWARRAPATWVRAGYYGGALRLLCAGIAPATVEGEEHVASLSGPMVIVANHASHADTMIVATALPTRIRRRLVVAAAADVWFTSRAMSTFSAVCIGAIPVDRTRVSRTTLELCHQLLGDGHSLLIYPEGGRADDPTTIGEFKPGAAWIARRAGVPVLPVHLRGTADVLPKGASLPHRRPVRIRFGELMALHDDEDARDFNRRIEAAVRALAD